jgi:hypothetical protein
MVQCEYILDTGEQCSKEATADSNLCTQHLNISSKQFAEIDLSFPEEQFSLLHITTFYGLQDILEQGQITASEKFKKVFLSFIFPTDKLKPFEGCKSKFVSILLNPQFFEDCSTKRLPGNKFGTCHFTPFWAVGEKQPQSYKYKWNKEKYTLKDNLNFILNLQRQYNFSSFGLEQENELVVDEKVSLDKYIEGIYIPQDFVPEYEDNFDLDEFKAQFPGYYFIDPTLEADRKRYGKFIDFKAYKLYEEPDIIDDEYTIPEN